MQSNSDPVFIEFLSESDEIIQRISLNLSRIEKGEFSADIVNEMYRDMHTMKGSAQLFGLTDIGNVAHSVETCLDPVRRNVVKPEPGLIDAIYKCVDVIETLLAGLKDPKTKIDVKTKINETLPRLYECACKQFGSEISLEKDILGFEDSTKIKVSNIQKSEKVVSTVSAEITVGKEPLREESDKKEISQDADSSIRVQVWLLDSLMNLVGEMVLVRNQVLQHSSRSENLEFLNLSQRLDVVTSELQDQVMRTRMQPIGNVLSKFQRITRDLSKELNKKIDLTIQGKDTELDKTLLEAIKDPLTHIVRNSCDHGIEIPQERLNSKKPETGHILIRSFHEGGQVIVEISDDGRGINRSKVIQKAIEKGLISTESAERMSDRDKLGLIFHPGFSTAEQVSAVSGRGVGMDVVKTNIEKIGGSVEVESTEGRGSTIRLRIPLTLAIVPAMLVRSGNDIYSIPQIKLVELVRVERGVADGAQKGIQFVQGKPVCELRGRLLPLIDLKQVLRPTPKEASSFDNHSSTINIVVLNAEGEVFGLIVDEVLDTADIVVKPLSKFLKSLDVFSAATILGSGNVALILDPMGLVKVANLALEKKSTESDYLTANAAVLKASDSQEYLLFRTVEEGKYAIPLCMVNRLEEFKTENIEYSGHQRVMRYRDSILPLMDINEMLNFDTLKKEERSSFATIVVQRTGRSFGIIVDEILDVCVIDQTIDDSIKDRFGILGNLIFGNEVINVIDALSIIEKESGKISGSTGGAVSAIKPLEPNRHKMKILYAEDVGFFRRQVAKLLLDEGYDVIAVPDGREAMNVLNSPAGSGFSLILSDIEMPHMSGLDLARAVRCHAVHKSIPMIALTTRFRKKDIEDGRSAGFDDYLEKLNPEILIKRVSGILKNKSDKESA